MASLTRSLCEIMKKKVFRVLSAFYFVLAMITKNINQSVTVVTKIFCISPASRAALIGSMENKCSSKISKHPKGHVLTIMTLRNESGLLAYETTPETVHGNTDLVVERKNIK